MNRICAGILLASAVLAHAAPRHTTDAGIAPAGNARQIAAAREALRRTAETLGEDHPATAVMLGNLALAMRQGGYFNYAEHYAQQALTTLERHFGLHDVSLVPVLNVLAEAAVSQGKYDEGRKLALRAVAIGPAAGAHYGTALHDLAAVYQAEGQLQEAAEFYRQALAAREKFLPYGHPYTASTRAALEQVQRFVKTSARR